MHLTIATAGHIDHGKSALIHALTGTHPDRLPEEQARGISIELGFAHGQVGETTLSFVDVPGHERFVRTMLAGVGGIDAVLLVVSADESVMPQTREHLAICRLLDVPTGVIALTKCDLADATMQAIAADDVRALVAETTLRDAEIVPVSARTGAGLDALRGALVRCAARARDRDAPPRLPIDRVFTIKGFGTVVTGTLWTGRLTADWPVRLEPGERDVRVRAIQVHGAPATSAQAGQRVAVNLAGVSHHDVRRGDVLAGDGVVLVSRRLGVDVQVLETAAAIRHGTRLHVHLGTTEVLGRLLLPKSDAAGQGREIPPGGRALALLRLETPVPVRRNDRLVLRAYSPMTTLGGGIVVDPLASPRAGDVTTLAATQEATTAEWLEARVREAGTLGLSGTELPARCGAAPAEAHALARAIAETGRIVGIGPFWLAAAALETMRLRILAAVDAARASDPMAGGVPRATLRMLGGRRWRVDAVDHVLTRLTADGVLHGDERLARVESQDAGRDAVEARVLSSIAEQSLKGMAVADLETAPAIGLDRRALSAVLSRLVKARDVERLGDLYIASARLQEVSAELRQLAGTVEAPATIEVGWFKQRYGLTRRTAIPLLEWLDRTRVTRRQGDARVLIGTPCA